MKLFVFLAVTTAFVLVGCQDERGFRAKQFPTTAAQARQQACGSSVCPEKVPSKTPDSGNTGNTGGSQAPAKPAPATPPAPVVPAPSAPAPIPGNQGGNNDKPVTKAVSQADEVFDAAALVMKDDPTVSDDDAKKSFRQNLTPDKAKIAADVVQGFDMKWQTSDDKLSANVNVTAVINDDGTPKSLVATGAIPFNAEKNKGIQLVSNLTSTVVTAFLCAQPQCDQGLLRVVLQVNAGDKGIVTAVFFQAVTDDGKATQIMSSIDPTKPFAKKPFAIESTAPKTDGDTPIKGDPSAEKKAPIAAPPVKADAPKSQDKVDQDSTDNNDAAAPSLNTLRWQQAMKKINAKAAAGDAAPDDKAATGDDGANTAKNFSAWQTIMYRLTHHGRSPKADDAANVEKPADGAPASADSVWQDFQDRFNKGATAAAPAPAAPAPLKPDDLNIDNR